MPKFKCIKDNVRFEDRVWREGEIYDGPEPKDGKGNSLLIAKTKKGRKGNRISGAAFIKFEKPKKAKPAPAPNSYQGDSVNLKEEIKRLEKATSPLTEDENVRLGELKEAQEKAGKEQK